MTRPTSRHSLIAIAALLFAASCKDAPTSVKPCELAALGPTLTYVVQDPAALIPALEDARVRLLPALTTPSPEFAQSMETLGERLIASTKESRCTAFNIVAERFQQIAASAPASEGPDIESVRLVLRLTHAYLAAN